MLIYLTSFALMCLSANTHTPSSTASDEPSSTGILMHDPSSFSMPDNSSDCHLVCGTQVSPKLFSYYSPRLTGLAADEESHDFLCSHIQSVAVLFPCPDAEISGPLQKAFKAVPKLRCLSRRFSRWWFQFKARIHIERQLFHRAKLEAGMRDNLKASMERAGRCDQLDAAPEPLEHDMLALLRNVNGRACSLPDRKEWLNRLLPPYREHHLDSQSETRPIAANQEIWTHFAKCFVLEWLEWERTLVACSSSFEQSDATCQDVKREALAFLIENVALYHDCAEQRYERCTWLAKTGDVQYEGCLEQENLRCQLLAQAEEDLLAE